MKLKKEPIHNYEHQSNRTIALTGMRNEEGGNRDRLSCVITDNNGKIKKFHPLVKVNEEFENWFINKHNIKICKLYYPPYNFERTGCRGCPFALKLQEQLDIMPTNERKQCELIWKPVYDEYRRIGYRLRNELSLFDFINNS